MSSVDFNTVSASYPAQLVSRVKYEINLFEKDPPPGISAYIVNNHINSFEASVVGPQDTPYDKGVFKLEISLPFKYPIEPPQIKFVTPIYHPNIDSNGRICLDILYSSPKGEWKPSLNLPSVLTSIRLLMSNPNPYDPLMNDITEIYKNNHSQFLKNAQSWTKKYAMNNQIDKEPEQNEFRKKRLRGNEQVESKYEPNSKSLKYLRKTSTTTTTSTNDINNNNNNYSDSEDEDDYNSVDSDDIPSDEDILKKNSHILNGNHTNGNGNGNLNGNGNGNNVQVEDNNNNTYDDEWD